jgi:hypothetical protein
LELHLFDALQHLPNSLPSQVCFTDAPQRPSRLMAGPVCVGLAEDVDVA